MLFISIVLVISYLSEISISSGYCSDLYSEFSFTQDFRDECFLGVNKRLDYWDSFRYCEDRGLSFVSIHNEEENSALYSLNYKMGDDGVQSWLRIGLSDLSSLGDFSWVDDSPLDYTNWNEEIYSPRRRTYEHEDCVVQVPPDGLWMEDNCAWVRRFACRGFQNWTCNGVYFNSDTVCEGHGTCLYEGKCVCDDGYKGTWCDKEAKKGPQFVQVTATDTEDSSNGTFHLCFGKAHDASDVCNGDGLCTDEDTCECEYNMGAECDSNVSAIVWISVVSFIFVIVSLPCLCLFCLLVPLIILVLVLFFFVCIAGVSVLLFVVVCISRFRASKKVRQDEKHIPVEDSDNDCELVPIESTSQSSVNRLRSQVEPQSPVSPVVRHVHFQVPAAVSTSVSIPRTTARVQSPTVIPQSPTFTSPNNSNIFVNNNNSNSWGQNRIQPRQVVSMNNSRPVHHHHHPITTPSSSQQHSVSFSGGGSLSSMIRDGNILTPALNPSIGSNYSSGDVPKKENTILTDSESSTQDDKGIFSQIRERMQIQEPESGKKKKPVNPPRKEKITKKVSSTKNNPTQDSSSKKTGSSSGSSSRGSSKFNNELLLKEDKFNKRGDNEEKEEEGEAIDNKMKIYEIPQEKIQIFHERVKGTGGFGKVIEGVLELKRNLKQIVAVKEIVLTDEKMRKEVITEFKNQLSLVHPNVVEVFGYTVPRPNTLGIVMELMDMDLMTFVLNIQSTIAKKLEIMKKMVDSVHFLHTRNPMILHRDIKSLNFLVTEDGEEVKISDFGLVKTKTSSLSYTQTGKLAGTMKFMAPECFSSEKGKYSVYTDIYALGITFWEVIFGKQAYEGFESMVVMFQVTSQGLRPKLNEPPLPDLVKDDLEKLLKWMWSHKAENRPDTMDLLDWFESTGKELMEKSKELYFLKKLDTE